VTVQQFPAFYQKKFREEYSLDVLERFILERVKCRFHPFLSETARWRHYPLHISKLLEG